MPLTSQGGPGHPRPRGQAELTRRADDPRAAARLPRGPEELIREASEPEMVPPRGVRRTMAARARDTEHAPAVPARMLDSRASLRRAMLLRAIIGPPRAMQRPGER